VGYTTVPKFQRLCILGHNGAAEIGIIIIIINIIVNGISVYTGYAA